MRNITPVDAPVCAPPGAYIHVPFCKKKCNYCAFVSYENTDAKNRYIEQLIQEIKYFYTGEKLKTIYFGGGTPSLLDPKDFDSILNCFSFDSETEITAEVNPDSADYKFLQAIKKAGVNRLSVGIQTFNDEILKVIGRLHKAETAVNTVHNAQKAGFENISTDFIYGLPNQTMEDFQTDLKKALSLGIDHISLYGLKIEEGSKFAKKKPANPTNEDLQAEMFRCAHETLLKKGMIHYEISNYAVEGKESKHNLNYWNNEEYYGFGPAAHGYVNNIRYSNYPDLQNYLKDPIKKYVSHTVTPAEKLEEEIFLGFRKCEGLDIQKINENYSIDFENKYEKIINKYRDFLEITSGRIKLTQEGILLSNSILCEFLE